MGCGGSFSPPLSPFFHSPPNPPFSSSLMCLFVLFFSTTTLIHPIQKRKKATYRTPPFLPETYSIQTRPEKVCGVDIPFWNKNQPSRAHFSTGLYCGSEVERMLEETAKTKRSQRTVSVASRTNGFCADKKGWSVPSQPTAGWRCHEKSEKREGRRVG